MDQFNKKVITKYIYKTNRTEERSKESRGTRGEHRKEAWNHTSKWNDGRCSRSVEENNWRRKEPRW